MPRRYSLVLADIVGSTRIAERLGDEAMGRVWAEHDRIARDLLRTWQGREIDKADGMFSLFEEAGGAAGYALDYLRALQELSVPLEARVAMHVGPVVLRANPEDDVARGAKPLEVDGLAKSIVARTMSVAKSGQVLLTSAAQEALVSTALRTYSHGHWRFAGISEPMELFETCRSGSAPVTPKDNDKAYRVVRHQELWVPLNEVRHNLPAERDGFIGRADLLQVLAASLIEEGCRLVTLLGSGGAGKTRLAIRFAWSWLGEFAGGAWVCDLSQSRSSDAIALAMAQGLGVTLNQTDPIRQLGDAIAERGRCLVLLDNFELVTAFAEATLGHWLDRAPSARFLVTSRERLSLQGEHVVEVGALPSPEATMLFLDRARSVERAYRATDSDQAAIAKLVRMLDGLPLAIELAAARISVFPPSAIVARMHERFEILRSRTGRITRQATLRAMIDWSWDLLTDAEKAMLGQLSVFRGGFTFESVRRVVELPPPGRDSDSADVLEGLLDKSLVRKVGQDRFDLLESVRAYAREHLETEGRFDGSGPAACDAAKRRHGEYFGSLGSQRAAEHACIELDNLVTSCRRAIDADNGPLAVRVLVGCWGALERRGPFRLAVELAQQVREVRSLASRDSIHADVVYGSALQLSGRVAEARQVLRSAAAAAQEVGDRTLEADALNVVAPLHAQSGDVEDARKAFEKALQIVRDLGDLSRQCGVLSGLGGLCESLGQMDEARQHYEACLRASRAVGHRRWEGGAAGNLAQFLANQGRAAEARPLYEQAVAIAHELGDDQWEANGRCNLGLLHFSEGRIADARAELQAALETAQAMGYAKLLSVVECNLGLVEEASGNAEAALNHHEAAFALARDRGDLRSEGQFLTYLGLLHAHQGRYERARSCLVEGEAALDGVGDRVSLGILLTARAEAEHLAGHSEAATSVFAKALDLSASISGMDPTSELGRALERVRSLVDAPRI